jgi:DNA polymerase III delta subunit
LIVKSFEAMEKQMESASTGTAYLVSGDEYYQSNRLLDILRRRASILSLEVVRVMPDDLGGISLSALFSEGSLFSAGKLVIIGEVDKLGKSHMNELKKIIAGRFDHILYCRTEGRKPSNLFIKELESVGTAFTCWEPFANQMWKWTKRLADEEKIKLSRDGAEAAEALASGKLEKLADIIVRISIFHGKGSLVNASGVYAAVQGVQETSAFQFCEEILKGEKSAAMRSLSLLLDSGEEPIRLLALLYSQWKQVAGARELLAKGISPKAAAQKLGVPPFRWPAIEELAGRRSRGATSYLLETFAAADHGLKTGIDPLAAIASVVLSLTSAF